MLCIFKLLKYFDFWDFFVYQWSVITVCRVCWARERDDYFWLMWQCSLRLWFSVHNSAIPEWRFQLKKFVLWLYLEHLALFQESQIMIVQVKNSKSTHLDVRTFELWLQYAVAAVACNMESVTMAVSNQNVARIRYIDAIREAGDLFTSNATLELTGFIEHSNAMALKVAHIKIVSCCFFVFIKQFEIQLLFVI